jgi:hypothetical protein
MPKEKKTIQIEYIKDFVNKQLVNPNYTMEEKNGIITMLERILLDSNAYKGYMFLHLDENDKAPSRDTAEYYLRKYF